MRIGLAMIFVYYIKIIMKGLTLMPSPKGDQSVKPSRINLSESK